MRLSPEVRHQIMDKVLLFGIPALILVSLGMVGYYLIYVPNDTAGVWMVWLLGAIHGCLLRLVHRVMRGDYE